MQENINISKVDKKRNKLLKKWEIFTKKIVNVLYLLGKCMEYT